MVLLQPAERLEQTILPITRDRLRLAIAIGFELAARDPQPLTPAIPTQHATTKDRRLEIDLQLGDRPVVADRPSFAFLDPPLRLSERLAAALRGVQSDEKAVVRGGASRRLHAT